MDGTHRFGGGSGFLCAVEAQAHLGDEAETVENSESDWHPPPSLITIVLLEYNSPSIIVAHRIGRGMGARPTILFTRFLSMNPSHFPWQGVRRAIIIE